MKSQDTKELFLEMPWKGRRKFGDGGHRGLEVRLVGVQFMGGIAAWPEQGKEE